MSHRHQRSLVVGLTFLLVTGTVVWAQRQPKAPPPVTEFENQTLPLAPMRGVDPKTVELNEERQDLNDGWDLDVRWDDARYLEDLDRVYEHAQQEFDAFDRTGMRPIGEIPEIVPGGGDVLWIGPGDDVDLDGSDLGGIEDESELGEMVDRAGITDEDLGDDDLGVESGDESLSEDELARQLGLEPLDNPAPRTEITPERNDGAETEHDLLQDAHRRGPDPKAGNEIDDEIDVSALNAILQEELELLGEEDSDSRPDSKTTSSDPIATNRDHAITSRDNPTTDAGTTGGQQASEPSASSPPAAASGNRPTLLDQILPEKTGGGEVENRPTNRVGLQQRGSAGREADALLDAIAAEDDGTLKQPTGNSFSIDDLVTVDPDEITNQPTIEELLAGFGGASHEEFREQADRYLNSTNEPDMNAFRDQAGQLDQKLTAAQRAEQERIRQQQLETQRQRREQAEQNERWRQQQLARQRAAEYEQWRQNQIAYQQQVTRQQQFAQEQYQRAQRWAAFARQVQAASQQYQQPRYRQPNYGGWNSGGYRGMGAPSDGSILGSNYRP